MGKMRRFVWALTRRKPMDISEEAPTDLDRCLNTLDLTAMGVGATLGFGLYVLSGEVAAQKAGPGVVLSFMIAAIASTFSALCYAEFAAKVPKSGSAYAYSYITVGEFVAFVIGWNLTLEHVIGTASLARGYSGYLGSLFDQQATIVSSSAAAVSEQMSAAAANDSVAALLTSAHDELAAWAPEFMQGYVTHFDWLAFLLTTLVTGLLLLGVQVSSRFQITFASINLSVACFIFVCGLFKADLHNWRLRPDEIPATAGTGGFLPFGWSGVIAGAGTCFFAFVGFDGIAATAEEVKNPRRAIPNSILWTSAIIFVTYSCMATIQTLIWPYWDQKQPAPLPYIFEKLEMHFAKWTILVGVLAGLSTSFVGGFLPLPRILYAMARDGVIYRVLSIVSRRFKVPVVATIVGGILIACLASMLEIDQLADMLSIGTLAAYSLVSISVLLLRYEYRKPTNCEDPLPVTFQEAERDLAKIERLVESQRAANIRMSAAAGAGNGLGAGQGEKEAAVAKRGEDIIETNLANVGSSAADYERPAGRSKKSIGGGGGGGSGGDDSGSGSSVSGSERISIHSGKGIDGNGGGSDNESCSSSGTSSVSSIEGRSTGNGSLKSSRSLLALFVDGTKCAPPRDGAQGAVSSVGRRLPDAQTTHISRLLILILVLITTALDFALVFWGPWLADLEPISVGVCSTLFILTIALGFLLNRLPVAERSTNSFEVPLVPTIPLFSVIINTYLMLNLSFMTWIRFAVWMTIGFFIYFTYGIFQSTGYKDARCD